MIPLNGITSVLNALTNFANVTLSSLYFDITKDCLYANAIDSLERRAVITVLEHVNSISIYSILLLLKISKVLSTMTSVLAPVLPHLAEEIHQALHGDGEIEYDGGSFFNTIWKPLVVLHFALHEFLTESN